MSDDNPFSLLPLLYASESHFHAPEVQRLSAVLKKYDKHQALMAVAGMLIDPKLQANCYRLEMLAHLVLINCEGENSVTTKHISNWLSRQLGSVAFMEDPAEDVFVSNVISSTGDYLVLGGIWEVPDAATTLLIRSIEQQGGEEQLNWLKSPYALLALSDFILKRANLQRWHMEASIPKRSIEFGVKPLSEWSSRAIVSMAELNEIGISVSDLAPFVFGQSELAQLIGESGQDSTLNLKPLLRIGNDFLLVMPTAVTYAARRYILRQAESVAQLPPLNNAVINFVTDSIMLLLRSGSRHDIAPVDLPPLLRNVDGLSYSLVYRIGMRRFIHILTLDEPIEKIARDGLTWPSEFSDEAEEAIHKHIVQIQEYLENEYEVDFGHTLAMVGHLGQAAVLTPAPKRKRWTFDTCRIHDLECLLHGSDDPLDNLLLLLQQRETMAEEGLYLPNTNGLLNLFAYWVDQDCCLRIADMPYNQAGHLQIATDFVAAYRNKRRRNIDEHCLPTVHNSMTIVVKANSDSVYASERDIPVYVSMDLLKVGILSFCIPHGHTAIWVTMHANGVDSEVRHMTYKLWDGLQLLIHRTLNILGPCLVFNDRAIEIIFDLSSVLSPQEARDDQNLPDDIEILSHKSLPRVKLNAQSGFLRSFGGVENLGERRVLGRVVAALHLLAGLDIPSQEVCLDIALKVLGGNDAKIFHTFETFNPIDILISNQTRRVFRRPSEHVGASMRSAFGDVAPATKRSFNKADSCKALNDAVTRLATLVITKLARFDRLLLIKELLVEHESLIRDKARWRMTARAVRGLHGDIDGTVAANRTQQERSEAMLTLRVLMEAAICESPVSGGKAPDGFSIDELYGLMCTLISLGRDSETIFHDLASEGITIFPSGAYSFTADSLATIGAHYGLDSFTASYKAAAMDYESWVQPSEPKADSSTKGEFGNNEFRTAFISEFGLSLDSFLDIIGTLLDVGIETESIVVTISQPELQVKCRNKSISDEELAAFLRSFSLPSRPTWLPQPPLTQPKDIEPWRFERKLSVMLRPLLECSSESSATYIFGVATMREAMVYILDATTTGRFDKDVFSSKLMRSYIGRRVDNLGREFTNRVANALRAMGWEAKTEVKMSTLGAGKKPNLGDIDVLAWQSTGKVLAIECKRLKAARSISEIAQNCFRFRGNEGDHLYKHIRRVTWLRNNSNEFASYLGIPLETLSLRAPLVTNVNVPFKYLSDLPISQSDVIPFAELHCFAEVGFQQALLED